MARKKELTSERRAEIVILRKTGKTYSKIAQFVGVSKNGVFTTLKRHSETGANIDRKRCGRPKKLLNEMTTG